MKVSLENLEVRSLVLHCSTASQVILVLIMELWSVDLMLSSSGFYYDKNREEIFLPLTITEYDVNEKLAHLTDL